jgi:hypothetical protein
VTLRFKRRRRISQFFFFITPRYHPIYSQNTTSTHYCANLNCWTETTEEYCDLHHCAARGCQDERQTGQYCANHGMCTKYGCKEPRCIQDERYGPRPFCGGHWYTCRAPDCFVHEHSDKPEYCKTHKCRHLGCEEKVADDFAPNAFCTIHRCRTFSNGCYRDTYGFRCGGYGANAHAGRLYCTSCTCTETGCFKKTCIIDTKNDTCSLACSRHRCLSQGCKQPRESNTTYCIEHIYCSKRHCEENRIVGELFCSAHKKTCIRVDCFKARQHLGEWYTHREGWKKTQEWRVIGGVAEACSIHKCRKAECGNILALDVAKSYCNKHTPPS